MQFSILTRIFIGYAVVLGTFAGVSLFSVRELHDNQVQIRLVSEGYLGLSQSAARLETVQKGQADETSQLRDEPSVLIRRQRIKLMRQYVFEQVQELLASGATTTQHMLTFAPDPERPFIDDVAERFRDLKRAYADYQTLAEPVYSLLEKPTEELSAVDADLVQAGLEKMVRTETALRSAIARLQGALQTRTFERVHQAQERERQTGVAILGLSVLAIIVGIFATAIAARALRPVKTLIDGVSRIGRGDYSTQLGVSGADEIATLARAFDAMAKSLKEREAQLARQQEALLRAERLAAVGQVSAHIAHEVRNPLSSIGLNVEMLQDHVAGATFEDAANQKEALDLLHSVIREVDRLTEITEDYLKLARLPPPVLQKRDAVEIVKDVLGLASAELQDAGISVRTEFGNTPVPIQADENQVKQVLHNLIRNSKDAMPEGGVIDIAVETKPSEVHVSMADSGVGIAPGTADKVFEPFFTTKAGGTGLGLALSKQILQAHGGRVEMKSNSGPGACFTLVFPRP